MNKDQIKETSRQMEGKISEHARKVLEVSRMEMKGKLRKPEGKV